MAREHISGVILSGGQGARMGNVDKGLQLYEGRALLAHVVARFAPQVDELLISANRNLEQYAAYGYRIIEDEQRDFAGPLAGVQRALQAARYDLLATVPCDSPFLPLDLVDRLYLSMNDESVDIGIARDNDRTHPVFSLIRKRVRPHLDVFFSNGGRKFRDWYATLKVVEVTFDASAFENYNTLEDLHSKRHK